MSSDAAVISGSPSHIGLMIVVLVNFTWTVARDYPSLFVPNLCIHSLAIDDNFSHLSWHSST